MFSLDGFGSKELGHWVCSYYDGVDIYIYDSLNLQYLHPHQKIYLEHLYSFFSFDTQKVKFPRVQEQKNGVDCGVHAIMNALCLFYGFFPDLIQFDTSMMRSHLHKIFSNNILEQFPILKIDNLSNHNSSEVQKIDLTVNTSQNYSSASNNIKNNLKHTLDDSISNSYDVKRKKFKNKENIQNIFEQKERERSKNYYNQNKDEINRKKRVKYHKKKH